MFKADLQRRLERIFGIAKTTYDAPNHEALEQDTMFIEITYVLGRLSGTDRATARVGGFITVFSQADRLPYGFFAKRIARADPSDTRRLFFQREVDLQDSPARLQNLHERRVGFTFLYDAQYDPDKGSLTELTMEI